MPFLKNVVYSATICPLRATPDGDTPDMLELCEEANCFIVWRHNFDLAISDPEALVAHFSLAARDKAIEFAVGLATHLISEQLDKEAHDARTQTDQSK